MMILRACLLATALLFVGSSFPLGATECSKCEKKYYKK